MGIETQLLNWAARSRSSRLAACHLLRHKKQKTTVRLFQLTEQTTEPPHETRFFTCAAPRDLVSCLSFRKIRKLRRLLPIVEKLIEWNFHGARKLLQSLDRRNGMPVFDARNIAPEQPCALFDIALGEIFGLSE
jgi:hypothetical protein